MNQSQSLNDENPLGLCVWSQNFKVINLRVLKTTMMADLRQLKTTNRKTQCIVFGYIRHQEHQLNVNIIQLVQWLILSYYWVYEKFTAHGKDLVMNDECNKISGIHDVRECDKDDKGIDHTAYGNHVINFKDESIIKCKWSFVYLNETEQCLVFGFDSAGDKYAHAEFSGDRGYTERVYAVGTNGCSQCSYDNDNFEWEMLQQRLMAILN